MAILAALIVAGLVFNVYGLVTRRGRRQQERSAADARHSAIIAPLPVMAEYAARQGWIGPSDAPGLDEATAGYVKDVLRTMHGAGQAADVPMSGPIYANVFAGQAGGRTFVVGNAWMEVGRTDRPGSFCVLHLGHVLPPLFVNLRRYRPPIRIFLKDVPFESERFNRQFQILALDREYATAVITERTMAILLERNDWVFFVEFSNLVCVSSSVLANAQDYADRLAAVVRFADLIPHFVHQDRALQMPTLPDGTTFDLMDPSSRKRFEEAIRAMPPEQRAQFLAQVQSEGARFIAGMLGRDIPPELEAKLQQQLTERLGQAPPSADRSPEDPPGSTFSP
jgi:hypothetical protein